ncbi:hypothetical protein [Gracilibacillus sp. YIM 98692]|uniref:hypothetical protein n=1 Tax=Gracilibacillus sp. YIM 98692 TaxID=2663532 RepID=UPI0013D36ED4|nr:hypothetical protein [Gracilibacillus sp. YIM 98692]
MYQQHQGMYHADHMKKMCNDYMNYHVYGDLNDGSQFEGIIISVDNNSVIILIPEDVEEGSFHRQYGYDDDYGRPRRRFRRYRRQRFPFDLLRGLFLFPFYPPYPYPYPYYPYY